jgi:cobalamin biosynthesis Co2+ chelatase CbiK
MIHWGSDFNQKSLKCQFKYNNIDLKEFHEGLAQHFTDYVVNIYGNQKIKELFRFLTGNQSPPYRVFEELKTDLDGNPIDVACVFTALGICWNNNFNQSFNELKNFNFLSVLYYPNDFRITFEEIKAKKPALDQERITRWWVIEPFNCPDIFLIDYFDEENKVKKRGSINGRKFGLC